MVTKIASPVGVTAGGTERGNTKLIVPETDKTLENTITKVLSSLPRTLVKTLDGLQGVEGNFEIGSLGRTEGVVEGIPGKVLIMDIKIPFAGLKVRGHLLVGSRVMGGTVSLNVEDPQRILTPDAPQGQQSINNITYTTMSPELALVCTNFASQLSLLRAISTTSAYNGRRLR